MFREFSRTNATKTWLAALCMAIFGLMLAASVAADSEPKFTTIDYPGAPHTFAYGINPAGDVVGEYLDDTGSGEHGFVLRNGEFISFDYPGSNGTAGLGINPRGDIVGQYWLYEDNIWTIHGFLLRDGNFYPIDVPDQPNTMPVKINPEGTIVGCYHVGNPGGGTVMNTMYGFVRDAAGVTSHPMNRTMNNGVNPAGDVVGAYYSPTTGRAEQSYLIRDGVMTWFQFPGSFATLAQDISPSGTIVGFHRTSLTGLGQFHGFVSEQGEMRSFDVPGATATRAFGVSATGDIVGSYVVGAGAAAVSHGFLLSHRGPKE